MIGKVIINIIIIVAVLLNSTNLTMNKSYASVEKNKKEYVITQSEESKFLEDIYKTETDTLKIKSIDKKVSEQNYIEKEIVETKVLDKSNDQYVRNNFGNTREYNDDNYKGTLELTNYNIKVIDNGAYETIDEKVLEFINYTDNDLINIEKEITINNITYYLINVEWEPDTVENVDGEDIPVNYKGRKIYQTVKIIKNPDTYKITVIYTGTVEKKDTIYEYSITFDEKNIQDEKEESKEETEDKKDTNIVAPIIISGAGFLGMLMWFYKEKMDNKVKRTSKTNDKKQK